jgi:hypothetical protein
LRKQEANGSLGERMVIDWFDDDENVAPSGDGLARPASQVDLSAAAERKFNDPAQPPERTDAVCGYS